MPPFRSRKDRKIISEALPRSEQLVKLISSCLGREQILDTGLRLGEILDARYTKRELPRRMEWRADLRLELNILERQIGRRLLNQLIKFLQRL
jgi:hypothetical protein